MALAVGIEMLVGSILDFLAFRRFSPVVERKNAINHGGLFEYAQIGKGNCEFNLAFVKWGAF